MVADCFKDNSHFSLTSAYTFAPARFIATLCKTKKDVNFRSVKFITLSLFKMTFAYNAFRIVYNRKTQKI